MNKMKKKMSNLCGDPFDVTDRIHDTESTIAFIVKQCCKSKVVGGTSTGCLMLKIWKPWPKTSWRKKFCTWSIHKYFTSFWKHLTFRSYTKTTCHLAFCFKNFLWLFFFNFCYTSFSLSYLFNGSNRRTRKLQNFGANFDYLGCVKPVLSFWKFASINLLC